MASIEVFVYAVRIPAEQFILLVPGEWAFGRHRLLQDGVALLFEAQEDFLWQRAGLSEDDEIGAAFLLEVRERAAEMEFGLSCSAFVPTADSGGVTMSGEGVGDSGAFVPSTGTVLELAAGDGCATCLRSESWWNPSDITSRGVARLFS